MEKMPDADTLDGPLVFCTISGQESGWYHVVVHTSARTTDDARAAAASFLDGLWHGKRKIVRTEPEAQEERDFERDCRVVSGYCRFSFRMDEDGPIEHLQEAFGSGIKYVSFGA